MTFSQLTDLKQKMDRFRPLTKDEIKSIEKEKKFDHV